MKIKCPFCYQKISVESQYAGTRQQCPACNEFFKVPEPVAILIQDRQREKAANEIVFFDGHPSLWNYWGLMLLSIGMISASIIMMLMNRRYYPPEIFYPGVLILIVLLIFKFSKHYRITNYGISAVTGLFSRKEINIRMRDIRVINLRRPLIPIVFGLGDILIGTAGTSGVEMVISGLRHSVGIKKKLTAAWEEAKE